MPQYIAALRLNFLVLDGRGLNAWATTIGMAMPRHFAPLGYGSDTSRIIEKINMTKISLNAKVLPSNKCL